VDEGLGQSQRLGGVAGGDPDGFGAAAITPLVVAVARRKFKGNRPDEAKATSLAHMDRTPQEAIRQGGDYSLYTRKTTLALVAAYAGGKAIVDESAARAAVTEVTAE